MRRLGVHRVPLTSPTRKRGVCPPVLFQQRCQSDGAEADLAILQEFPASLDAGQSQIEFHETLSLCHQRLPDWARPALFSGRRFASNIRKRDTRYGVKRTE